MSTNKELFDTEMNSLATVLSDKTESTGKKTIDELITTANELRNSEFYTIYVDDSLYILNPYTFERYLGHQDNIPWTEEQKQTALEAICADYHLTKVTVTLEGEEVEGVQAPAGVVITPTAVLSMFGLPNLKIMTLLGMSAQLIQDAEETASGRFTLEPIGLIISDWQTTM